LLLLALCSIAACVADEQHAAPAAAAPATAGIGATNNANKNLALAGTNHLQARNVPHMKWEYEREFGLARSPAEQQKRQAQEQGPQRKSIRGYDARSAHAKHVGDLTSLLFPHAKSSDNPLRKLSRMGSTGEEAQALSPLSASAFDYHAQATHAQRELTVPCVICRDMGWCSALNGFQIQEVYLPYNLNDLGTCKVRPSCPTCYPSLSTYASPILIPHTNTPQHSPPTYTHTHTLTLTGPRCTGREGSRRGVWKRSHLPGHPPVQGHCNAVPVPVLRQ